MENAIVICTRHVGSHSWSQPNAPRLVQSITQFRVFDILPGRMPVDVVQPLLGIKIGKKFGIIVYGRKYVVLVQARCSTINADHDIQIMAIIPDTAEIE